MPVCFWVVYRKLPASQIPSPPPPAVVTGQTLTRVLSQGSGKPATNHSGVQEIDSSDGAGDDDCEVHDYGTDACESTFTPTPPGSSCPPLQLLPQLRRVPLDPNRPYNRPG